MSSACWNAAVFFHGREEVIPEMFLPIADQLERKGVRCTLLREYLLRHVGIDSADHGPRAERLLARLYRNDPAMRREAEAVALESLAVRERLWNAIAESLGAMQ